MANATVKLAPFLMPVYLRFADWKGDASNRFPAAMLTDAEAGKYWDDMRAEWISHVAKLRATRLQRTP